MKTTSRRLAGAFPKCRRVHGQGPAPANQPEAIGWAGATCEQPTVHPDLKDKP